MGMHLFPTRPVLPLGDDDLDVGWVALRHDDAPMLERLLALGIARVGQTCDAAAFLGNAGVVPWLTLRLGDFGYRRGFELEELTLVGAAAICHSVKPRLPAFCQSSSH